MGDMTEKRDEYLELCIRLRLASLLLSTAVYLRGMQTRGILNPSAWGIVIGMLVSCLLGNALYLRAETLKEERSRRAIGAILGLELAAYGIFIYMSGGLSSSYLWYGFCCILISLSGNLGSRISLVAVLWCFGCALRARATAIRCVSRAIFWSGCSSCSALSMCCEAPKIPSARGAKS